MSIWYLIIGLIVFFAVQFILVLYVFPSTKNEKKKKVPLKPIEENKDHLELIARLEKHIQSLKQEIVSWQHKEIVFDKQLTIEKAKVSKLQEKLSQEKGWLEKEEQAIDKKSKDVNRLKEELIALQEIFSKEHAENLRLQRQNNDAKTEIEGLHQNRRSLELELAQLNTNFQSISSEAKEFKMKNLELKRKQEDTQWIAKSEYDKVYRQLQEKEKELERIKREN